MAQKQTDTTKKGKKTAEGAAGRAKRGAKRRRLSGAGLALGAAALLAAVLFLTGGVGVTRPDAGRQALIRENVARLAALEAQEPVDLDLEARQKRLALIDSRGGVMVDDLAAEQERIMNLSNWTKAELRAWFSDAALVGDSLTLGAQSYGWLDDAVYADKGARVSTAGDLLDAVEAARPATVFLCFGVNDIAAYKSNVSTFLKRYAACVQRLQASLPYSAIYVNAVFPATPTVAKNRDYYKYLDDYNAGLKQMCQALGAYYVDSAFILQRRPALYSDDGMHPKKDFFPLWLTYLADIAGLSDYGE